jgi:hypothetical protein
MGELVCELGSERVNELISEKVSYGASELARGRVS